jgi:hypothetical protein
MGRDLQELGLGETFFVTMSKARSITEKTSIN